MIRYRIFLILFAALAWPASAQEGQGPIERQNLIRALQVGGLPEAEFAAIVKQRHLAFEMTVTDEETFRKAGAGELLIATLWENDAFKVPPGDPLTREQIVTLLQGGTPSRRMERMVRERKAKMVFEKAATDEIAKAGGSETLIGVISTNLIEEKRKVEVPSAPVPAVPLVKSPTPEEIRVKYDALIADAQKASGTGDRLHALEILDDAKKLDRARPDAFRLAGFISLYDLNEISRARLEYKEAVAKGGEVEFRVQHIHGRNKITMKEQFCFGRLWIDKTGARFEADDKVHIFKFMRNEIVEVDEDAAIKVVESGFHVKLNHGGNKAEPLHFRSARAKNKSEEDRLIVELLR
jgi:hypothetical protein